MANCSAVNIQCPNGRRQRVKLTANMTLLQVVQEVCKKQDLNPNMYNLKHQRKILDSSLTIRFANLPNNAHLELIQSAEERSVKKCVIALQLESGERLVHEFNSDSSLFNILMHWKTESRSITFDSTLDGVICIYANQQICGLEKLQTTTLSMIGLNGGRGVIRLIQPTTPTVLKPENTNATIEGIVVKPTELPGVSLVQESSLVQGKPSSEEMELASGSTSSVSMTSQTSEDNTVQHSEVETTDEQEQIAQSETCFNWASQSKVDSHQSSQSDSKVKLSSDLKNEMDFEQCEGDLNRGSQSQMRYMESNQPEADVSHGGKTQDAMDVEQCNIPSEVEKEKISSTVKLDTRRLSDAHPPPVEALASTSAQVQAFSGQGRTLGELGPDMKKPRLDSPYSLSSKTKDGSRRFENAENTESGVSPPEREAIAFCLGDSDKASTLDEVSDDFFEVTVDDLRLMLKDLKNDRTAEKPLMTTKMREEQEKEKMNQYEKVAIRVYFPDRIVLQGFFSPRETVSALTSFVSENLQHRDTHFYLYTTPPKRVLDKPNVTLFEANLCPAAIVHFGSRDAQESFLHSRHVEDMADLNSAKEKMNKYNRDVKRSSSSSIEIETTLPSGSQQANNSLANDNAPSSCDRHSSESRDNTRPNTSGKAVPKWFKLGK